MIEQKFVDRIAQEVGARPEQVAIAVQLFDKGATSPFVAHYRKDLTGNLDEGTLERIEERNVHYTAFINRRNAILQNIEKQEQITEEIREAILGCFDDTSLEDIYLPFKRKRRTRATVAIEQRLGPLADYVWAQAPSEQSLESFASQFIDPSKSISSAEEALDGARAILTEKLAQDAAVRALIRDRMWKEGKVCTSATKNAVGQKTKFESYYNFSEPLQTIPSHRLLAAMRGEKLGYLRLDLAIDDAKLLSDVLEHVLKSPGTPYEEQIRIVIEDAYRRHLRPELEHEVLANARERAEAEAIRVFQENARNLLMAPPAGQIPVMGVQHDPNAGTVVVVVDPGGTLREFATLKPQDDGAAAEKTLGELVEKFEIRAVAVGNGAGARETMRFVDGYLKRNPGRRTFAVYVNESGAAIYSASKIARDELPDVDMPVRAATSIARRLQDPLMELVKVEPRNIGVGQYQHDVNQRRLRDSLYRTIVSCVNRVGVDANTASVSLLRYVSGIQMGTAQNIVAHREKIGGFKSREQLLEVDGIGSKTYEQCAGFLRIRGGDNPLDATTIHPEAYAVVGLIAEHAGLPVSDLVGNKELLEKIDVKPFEREIIGSATLSDIHSELMRPGRDPRRRFRAPRFIEGVYALEDLQENMEAEGIVTNVTDFGAFVDIGIQQDGLVHLSELANRFVRDPRQVVKVGDIVRVRVIKVDRDQPRISLSIRAAVPPRPRRKKPAAARRPETAPEPAVVGATAQAAEAPPAARPRIRERGPERPDEERRPQRPRRDARERDRRPREEGERPQPRRERDGGGRRQGTRQGAPTEVKYGDNSGRGLNTQLADQLAELKKKLGA